MIRINKIAYPLMAALLCPLAGQADEASSEHRLIDENALERVQELMLEEGFRAKVKTFDDGGKTIRSASGGSNFSLHFSACDDANKNCEVITFSASFEYDSELPFDLINQWNLDRYSKAFIDEEGDPFLQHSVNVLHGISEQNFVDTLIWYGNELGDFEEHINWEEEITKSKEDEADEFAQPV